MGITRRTILGCVGSALSSRYLGSSEGDGGLLGSALGGLFRSTGSSSMARPPDVRGRIIADLHAHPSRENRLEDILGMLSWGVTGLAVRRSAPFILSYDDAVRLPGVKEIDQGIFASLTYNGSVGYFIRCQEVEGANHILALGCRSDVPLCDTSLQVVARIQRDGGVAVLNHPLLLPDASSPFHYRIVPPQEESSLFDLCHAVDEVESFNAQAAELIPMILDFRPVNVRAYALARRCGHRGMAASDAHYVLEQVKIAGNYIPSEGLCFEAIKHHIKSKDFIPYHQHVSRWSFIKGHSY